MPRPFKKKTVRNQLEDRLDDLAGQTEELRKQVVDRAPAVRDQLIDLIPDKGQLLDLRDDLFDKLPDNVAEKLPEQVKPKRSKFKRIAIVGVVTGGAAAAVAVLKGRSSSTPPPVPPAPTAAPSPRSTPAGDPTAAAAAGSTPAAKKAPVKKD